MSWPNWQAPTMTPAVGSNVAMPNPGMQYNPEQWAQMQQQNWQQWAQWQQQYQQWHQQYGAEYQKSMNAMAGMGAAIAPLPGMPNMGVPPPLPVEPKPPLPPDDPPPPQHPQQNFTTMPPNTPFPTPAQMQSYAQQPQANNFLNVSQIQPTNNAFVNPVVNAPFVNSTPQTSYTTPAPNQAGSTFPNQPQMNQPPPNFNPQQQNQQNFRQNQDFRQNWQGGNKRPFGGGEEGMAGNKRPMMDKPREFGQRQWQQNAVPPKQPNPEELSEAEKKFDKEFAAWEAQFNKWKEQNATHPDKEQYKEYEKKWESWRNSLLERREQMRKKRLSLTGKPYSPLVPNSGEGSGVETTVKAEVTKPAPIQNDEPLSFKANSNQANNESGKIKIIQNEVITSQPPPNLNNEPLSFKTSSGGEAIASSSQDKVEPVTENEEGSNFLKSSSTEGIPGLDLVKEGEEIVDEPEQVEPDYEAISKGINSILGDQKLLSMLSMVSKPNQTFDGQTETKSSLPLGTLPGPADPVSYNDQSNTSLEERSNQECFNQRESVTNFDDQTRSSFTLGPNDHEGKAFRDVGFDRSGRNNVFGGDQNNRGAYGNNRFSDELNQRDEGFGFGKVDQDLRGPGGFNRGPQDNFNNSFSGRGPPDSFRGRGHGDNFNRGPSDSFPNRGGPPDNFNRDNFDNRGPPGNFNRGPQDNFNNRGPQDNFNNRGPQDQFNNRGGPDNRGFQDNFNNRGPKDNFNNRGPQDNFNNRGPQDNFNNRGPQDKFNNRGPQDNFNNRGPQDNFGNRGPPDNFNNRGPQDNFGNRGPSDNFNNRGPPGIFNRSSQDFNRPTSRQDSFSSDRSNFNDQSGFNRPGDRFDRNDQWEDKEDFGDFDERINQENFDKNPPLAPKINPEDNPDDNLEELIFEPANIIDYDHKSLREETEVLIEPLHMFDYGHRRLNRIPIPQRPKWLMALVQNIREFDPLASRAYDRKSDTWRDLDDNKRTYNRPVRSSRDPPLRDQSSRDRSYKDRSYDSRSNRPDRPDRPGRPERLERTSGFEKQERTSGVEKQDQLDRFASRNRARNMPASQVIDLEDLSDDDDGILTGKKPVKKDEFEELSDEDMDWNNDENEMGDISQEVQKPKVDFGTVTMIEDLLKAPGRLTRPPRIVIILRGPPGSGKTHLAKIIKDKEVEAGGSAPRILSLDDYFMVEQEKTVVEEGKSVKVKEMVYEYEPEMEESYRTSLIKSFKKTITDGYFPFIIVDNVNDKIKYFGEMWSFAKQNGFQVFIGQLDLDIHLCTKRNVHGRSEKDIEDCVSGWEPLPSHYAIVDVSSILQSEEICEVEMEEVVSDEQGDSDCKVVEEDQVRSKWDNFDCSSNNLARLDGVSKPLRPSQSMEEYLQMDEPWETAPTKPGQKRVRWADLEEQKQQAKMRAIGFVVGQNHWGRMMDTSSGSSALTQTKYIERIKRN